MEKLTQRLTQSDLFSRNHGTYFDFQKMAGEASSPQPLMWVNVHQYP